MRISIHGFIGYAIMTAHDITDAIALANRFIQLRFTFFLYFSFGSQSNLFNLSNDIEVGTITILKLS